MEDLISEKKLFLAKSELNAHDLTFKRKLNSVLDNYDKDFESGKNQFAALDQARKQAKNVKWKAIEQLDHYLELFEKKFLEKGGKVLWAETDKEALAFINAICEEKKAKTILSSHSMVLEEIQLAEYLKKKKYSVIETDIGSYIQKLSLEPSFHMVHPVLNQTTEEIAQLFHEKLGTAPGLNAQELTIVAQKNVRNKFTTAEIGITGANFLIAEEGAVCITENEGNVHLATSFPKTNIVIAGIEKVLPNLKDLELFWPLLSTFATGQKLTAYNSIISGPRQPGEMDGPEDMYVIIIDNGRTNLLKQEIRESLYCIRCGACSNVCPVYKNIGGHAYGTTYNGPIGSVISPHLKGMSSFGHLSYASTLCGSCSAVCPIHIDIHGMLSKNRNFFVDEGNSPILERMAWRFFKNGMLHRTILNKTSAKMKNLIFRKIFSPLWGPRRKDIHFPNKSFNQLWKQEIRKKNK